jgi:hypothetical protein
MDGIFTLESSLNFMCNELIFNGHMELANKHFSNCIQFFIMARFIFHCPKIIVRKILNFQRCVGKKTALLQAEASACVLGLANVQFCALAVHYFVFFFCL